MAISENLKNLHYRADELANFAVLRDICRLYQAVLLKTGFLEKLNRVLK